jgi:hypothetical protein
LIGNNIFCHVKSPWTSSVLKTAWNDKSIHALA